MKININEQQLKIVVEAMMDGFSLEELKSLPIDKRIRYCKQMLGSPLGQGSSRMVFQIDDEKVLKLAMNNKGIAQNQAEADWYAQKNGCVPILFEEDADYLYIIMEYVLPAKRTDFKVCMGINFEQYCQFINSLYYEMKGEEYGKLLAPKIYNYLINNNENATNIYYYLTDRDMPIGDVRKLDSYGLAYRNGKPIIVLLDAGLTKSVFNDEYVTNPIYKWN